VPRFGVVVSAGRSRASRLLSLLRGKEKCCLLRAHDEIRSSSSTHTKKKRVFSLSLFREHARDDFTTVKPREKDPTTGVVFAVVKAPPFKQHQEKEEEEEFDEKRRMMISFVNEKKRTLTDFEKKEKGGEKRHARTHTKKKNETLRAFVVVVAVVGYFLNARRSVWSGSGTCSSAASLRGRGDRSKKKGRRRRRRRDKEVNF